MAFEIWCSSRRRAAPATIARRININQSTVRHFSSPLKANGIVTNYFFSSLFVHLTLIHKGWVWASASTRLKICQVFFSIWHVTTFEAEHLWFAMWISDRFVSLHFVNYVLKGCQKTLIILTWSTPERYDLNFSHSHEWQGAPEQCCWWHTILWMSNKLISVGGV